MARMKSEKVQCQFYNQTLYSTFYCGTATVSLHSCDLFWSLFQVCNRSPMYCWSQRTKVKDKSRVQLFFPSSPRSMLDYFCIQDFGMRSVAAYCSIIIIQLCVEKKRKSVCLTRGILQCSNIVASYILIHQEHNSWRTSNSKKMYSR